MVAPMAASLIAPMISSLIQLEVSLLINAISGKGVKRAGKKDEEVDFFHYLWKRSHKGCKKYNTVNHMDKSF